MSTRHDPRSATRDAFGLACASLLLLLLLGAGCSNAPDSPPDPSTASPTSRGESVKPGINESFLAEDLEVDEYVDRFEVESREVYRSREAILEALEIRPGEAVADVGAGTGLFLAPLSRRAGSTGKVYAVDISPVFAGHLRTRAREEGLSNVEVVLCAEDDARLPEGSVDVVFVCDTYHHFEYPARTLASLHRALRPGGRLCVVDFHRIPGVSREWLLGHVRAGQEVFRAEIESAGFRLAEEVEVPGLEENYFLRFERP